MDKAREKAKWVLAFLFLGGLASIFTSVYVAMNSTTELSPRQAGPIPSSVRRRPPSHLLSQPFYVYEDMLRDPSILNFTWICIYHHFKGDVCAKNNVTTFEGMFRAVKDYKEAGDYHFVNSALRHPMRTTDPEGAKLFVVPSLLQDVTARYCSAGESERENLDRVFLAFDDRLNASKYFQRQDGRDHILYHASWCSSIFESNRKSLNALDKCNLIQFYEDDFKWVHRPGYEEKRFHFASLYVNDPPCDEDTCLNHINPDRMKDIVFVGSMNRTREKSMRNHKLRVRREGCAQIRDSRHNFTYDTCGTGARCPAICGAKLGLHFRGDSWSSNRINSYFSARTIPIVTAEQQYTALPSFVDLGQLTYFTKADNGSIFESNLHWILSNETDLELKRHNVIKNRDLFIWESGVPFDVYMYQFQARIYPKTCVERSRFPALIMPQGNFFNGE